MAVAEGSPRYEDWIGATETAMDMAGPGPVSGLAALLDHVSPPWMGSALPPLAHWLYFLPRVPASQIDQDGHPRRGGFLPPISLPRRMWAGGEIEFLAPISFGDRLERVSKITDIRQKTGNTGALVFVEVEHHISANGELAVKERQDLVYREAVTAGGPAALPPPQRRADVERVFCVTPVDLFRFSALTFNAHRIHYDRDYARNVEGYAGLVVHGPLTATLLMDLILRTYPDAKPLSFAFRGGRPLLDTAPFTLSLARDGHAVSLWCRDSEGHETMTAKAMLAS